MILDDPELLKSVRTALEEREINVEAALLEATEVYAQMLESLNDDYLSARALDVRDVACRAVLEVCRREFGIEWASHCKQG